MNLPDWPWDEAPRDLVAALSAPLLSRFKSRQKIYLLIDPMLGNPPELEEFAGDKPRHEINGKPFGLDQEQAPYLIELEDRHDPLLDFSMELAIVEHLKACANGGSGAFRIGGWLQPYQDNAKLLTKQLGFLCQAPAKPNQGRYLRLVDRRVLQLLNQAPHGVEPIDWIKAMPGIEQWVWLDMNFGLKNIQGGPGPCQSKPLTLNAGQWSLLRQAQAINLSLLAWQQKEYPLPVDAVEQVIRGLENAKFQGLAGPEQQAAHAVKMLCGQRMNMTQLHQKPELGHQSQSYLNSAR